MRLNVFAALFAILLWGAAPAFAGPPPDVDGDGVADYADNCISASAGTNPAQEDTDGDSCGNICDADYDQSGFVDIFDLFDFLGFYLLVSAVHDHTEPFGGTSTVNIFDLFAFLDMYLTVPGPSGTTMGTPACP
jgi:hypothetical protein